MNIGLEQTPATVTDVIDAILNGADPAQMIAAAERRHKRTVYREGEVHWLPASDWKTAVVSIQGNMVRLLLLDARHPGTGAFTHLIECVTAMGKRPCVLAPTREFAATLKRRGWKKRFHAGVGVQTEERWTPRARIEK